MEQTMQQREPARRRAGSRKYLGMTAVIALLSTTVFLGVAAPAGAGDSEREIKVSGVGYPGGFGDSGCDDESHDGADYVIVMTGDLQGCTYGILLSDEYNEETGEYQSRDEETFVGSVGDLSGTWVMDEQFWARFDPDTGDQLSGGCEHDIREGSGTGEFASVDGELRFVDDVVAGNAPYFGVVKLK